MPSVYTMTFDKVYGTQMGLCFPEENRVIVGRASISSFSRALTWPSEELSGSFSLGNNAGQDDGELFFPLSLDRGPDGRYFVLDAGNERIQVFDEDGGYLTQCGAGGEASFDFGRGRIATDFAGSIAVDDAGFIYVADVGNRWVQKFAP